MSDQTITLNLPEPLYQKLRERAAQKHHSLETELLEVVTTAVPLADDLPQALVEALKGLTLLDDQALWKAARRKVSQRVVRRFRTLQNKKKQMGLTEAEAAEVTGLLLQFDQVMLVRAQAAVLLKERGFDITELGPIN